MGISGKSLNISVEDMRDAILEFGGRATQVAKKFGCTCMSVYRMIDEHDELKKARDEAAKRQSYKEVDMSYDVLERLLDACDSNPDLALKSAQTVLKSSKVSRLYKEDEKESTSSQETLSHLMMISRENALLKEKIAKLERASE